MDSKSKHLTLNFKKRFEHSSDVQLKVRCARAGGRVGAEAGGRGARGQGAAAERSLVHRQDMCSRRPALRRGVLDTQTASGTFQAGLAKYFRLGSLPAPKQGDVFQPDTRLRVGLGAKVGGLGCTRVAGAGSARGSGVAAARGGQSEQAQGLQQRWRAASPPSAFAVHGAVCQRVRRLQERLWCWEQLPNTCTVLCRRPQASSESDDVLFSVSAKKKHVLNKSTEIVRNRCGGRWRCSCDSGGAWGAPSAASG